MIELKLNLYEGSGLVDIVSNTEVRKTSKCLLYLMIPMTSGNGPAPRRALLLNQRHGAFLVEMHRVADFVAVPVVARTGPAALPSEIWIKICGYIGCDWRLWPSVRRTAIKMYESE